MEPLADKLPCVELYVICSEDGKVETTLPNAIDYETFIDGQATQCKWPEIDENSPLGLVTRAVLRQAQRRDVHPSLDLSAHDDDGWHGHHEFVFHRCVCGIVPMFHAMGWGMPFAATMLGSKQVMPHRFMQPERLLDLFSQEKVSLSAGVPTIWQGVRATYEADPDRWQLDELTRLTCGGSAPPAEMMRWYWDTLGIEMIQGWGMTETNPIGTISRRVSKRVQRDLTLDEQFTNIGKAG